MYNVKTVIAIMTLIVIIKMNFIHVYTSHEACLIVLDLKYKSN